jgi:hypothetical protein
MAEIDMSTEGIKKIYIITSDTCTAEDIYSEASSETKYNVKGKIIFHSNSFYLGDVVVLEKTNETTIIITGNGIYQTDTTKYNGSWKNNKFLRGVVIELNKFELNKFESFHTQKDIDTLFVDNYENSKHIEKSIIQFYQGGLRTPSPPKRKLQAPDAPRKKK